ncbi:sporulation protein YqfC [Thermobrachium celere]|uniref:Sporulation protein YqfC n=1 Tax=Thermobrachium celere DSM 8682 TaxID=941824 RepID=R7RS21_9CLOT|nr:sporulation protein YqfC [Thermobrachium celere]CDF58068.1 protein of unknown function DUF1429 [Thermobrachium celere DSM 8682]
MKRKLKHKISESLEMPKEVVLDIPCIRIIGTEEVEIENHKGIVEYNSNIVRVSSNIGTIQIKGENFIIKEISQDSIVLSGKVENVKLSNE